MERDCEEVREMLKGITGVLLEVEDQDRRTPDDAVREETVTGGA